MKFETKIRKNYDRKEPGYDYMKYYRVIRYWVKAKYGVSTPDLEMMFFLYSERIFNKTKFNEFEEIMSWDRNRFDRLLRDGWIGVWRKRHKSQTTLYELSYKGKRLIDVVYKKLNGEEISEEKNPLFLQSASYSDTVYRNMIIKLNQEIRFHNDQNHNR